MTGNIPRKYQQISYTLDEDEPEGDSDEAEYETNKKTRASSKPMHDDNPILNTRTRGAAKQTNI